MLSSSWRPPGLSGPLQVGRLLIDTADAACVLLDRPENATLLSSDSTAWACGRRGGSVSSNNVWVETVEFDSAGTRQIGPRVRTTALLRDRRDDIEAAVGEASAIIQESVTKVEDKGGWRVKSLEAKFGLTLAAEAGVILSKASAEASFEVTITIERG